MNDINTIDELQMYFGYPFKVNDYITITPPTVGEIIEWGEEKYYSLIAALTAVPSDMKSRLFDMGIDYEEISDYHLFIMLVKGLTPKDTSVLFGDFDFSKLTVCSRGDNEGVYLINKENGSILDEYAFLKIRNYIRKLHSVKPPVRTKAANKTTKNILIQLERDNIAKAKKEGYKHRLKNLISAMMRYPGFKYKSGELKECGLYEFMDTVAGAQIYIQSTALLTGSYSGMIDTSKINKKNFNWMREND